MSRRLKYFITYFTLMITILAIITVSVYNSFVMEMRKELMGTNLATLTQVQDVFERFVGDIQKTTLQMEKRLELIPNILADDYYIRYKSILLLQDYCLSNQLLSDIAIYYPQKMPRTIFSAQHGELSLETFVVSKTNDSEILSVDRFVELLKDTSVRSTYFVTQQNYRAEKTDYILTVFPFPSGTSTPYGYALFYMDEKTAGGIMRNAFIMKDGVMRIYSTTGQQLAAFSTVKAYSQIPSEKLLELSVKDTQTVETLLNNERFTAVASVGQSGFTYVMALPTSQFFEPVNKNMLSFMLAVGITFLVGLFLSFLFADKNSNLITALMGFLPRPEKEEKDIYLRVKKSIQSLSLDHNALALHSRSLEGIVRNHFLLLLIGSQRLDTPEFQHVEKLAGITLPHAQYVVFMLYIENYDEFIKNNSFSSQELYLYGIGNVFEELLSEHGSGYTFTPYNRRNVAILFNHNGCDFEEVRKKLQTGIDFAWEHYSISLTIGIGNSCASYEAIGRSFFEALRAALFDYENNVRTVLFFDQQESEGPLASIYPAELKEKILTAIRSGEQETARQTVGTFIAHVKLQSITRNMMYEHYFHLVNDIINSLSESFPQLTQQIYGQSLELFSKTWTDSFETELQDIISNIAREITDLRDGKEIDFAQKIKEYVDAHCYEQALSINVIAEEFGFSPSYITRFFRLQTGYTLKDYIDKQRMERARLLLATSSLTLKEIVVAIGYVDESSFIRKFKTIEKMTPAQYRIAARRYGTN